jgi:tRNA(fMet)-specific endonuclease VapC
LIKPEDVTDTRIMVDTDVFSFLFKKDELANFFKPYLINKTLALSFMSVAELYYGAYKDNWGSNRIAQLENSIKNYVVLPYDYLTCQEWARIRRQKELKGLTMSHSDIWVAASAVRYGCPIATNNGDHFQKIDGLIVICPGFI